MGRLDSFKPYIKPYHLTRLVDAIERTETQAVRAVVSVPPRHAKTQTMLHGIARRLQRRPWETIIYVGHTSKLARTMSAFARNYALKAGVRLRKDSASLAEWRTEEMGGCLFTSVGGPITGQGCNLLIIDDPHKDRAEAESSACRDNVWEWYQGTAYTRVEPGGSIILCHTRWHPDDLIGHATKEHVFEDWENLTFPAISDEGKALWPERWNLKSLTQRKLAVGEYDWASQYQGEPKPRGGAVFNDVYFYDPKALPPELKIRIGIDLAYSAKTKSDYSALVVIGQSREGNTYVLHVQRAQVEVPAFAAAIKAQADLYPGCSVHWHTASTEQGTAQLLRTLGVNVIHHMAKNDKFIRSQPVAAAWNAARVYLPGGESKPKWVNDFVAEIANFTGLNDRHDDMVDALASAFDAGNSVGMVALPRAFPIGFGVGDVGAHGAGRMPLKQLKLGFQKW